MDSASEFVDIFVRNWRERNGDELERLFKEGPRYFQNLSSTEIGILLENLLDDSKSLPKFLHDEVDKLKITNGFEQAIREGYTLLKYLITQFPTHYRAHIKKTFTICTFALEIKTGYYIKRAACQALRNLISTFPDYTTGLNDFASDSMKKKLIYTKNDFSIILSALCTIARHHPELPAITTHSTKIQFLLLEYLKETSNDPNRGVTYLEMYFDSLNDLLHNFPLQESITKKFYDLLKTLSTFAKFRIEINKHFIESIISFMTQHMQKLDSFIRNDHNYWYSFFNDLTKYESLDSIAREALKVYYEVLGEVLKRENSPEGRIILESLKGIFIKSLTDEYLTSPDLRIGIMGYCQLAEPLKRLIDDASVEEMFSLIARRTLPLYISEDDAQGQFDDIADYQEALATVLIQVADVTEDQIRILIKMCTLMIKRFPELKPEGQLYAAASLKRTIEHLRHLKIYIFDKFLSNIIYEGIVWSCSHSLLIDAELKKDVENLRKRPICYKDYIPLWESLLNNENYSLNTQEKISSELLNTCITLISKLDLRIKTREDNIFSDIAVSQIPENEEDFRIFLNLVDLFEEILSKIIEDCSSEGLKRLLKSFIEGSNSHPLVSGFYRLVKRLLNVSTSFSLQDNRLILEYLMKTIKLVFEFSHELQISCIQLILNCPRDLTSDLLPKISPVFSLAFKIGLNNYELADNSLEALEKFVTLGDNEGVEALLLDILPSLEVYLRSKESLEVHEDVILSAKRTTMAESNLELLQNKIFLFFGRINNSVMLQFLHKQSQNTGGTWDKKDLLEYMMTFPDGDLPVHLDTILPRIIELSLSCSDRRTRISACETLHSIIIIIVGKTPQYIYQDPERYAPLYKTLCPVLLKLGCDNDEVIRQIFNPFMLQMTHWLSSGIMLRSPVIGFLIECIFDGLCDDSDSSIKDFSGICLAEFVKWSIKQSTDDDFKRIPDNVGIVVENIKNFGLHPLKNRRVAGAIGFNHVYKILRENEEIVNIFWVEFLHCFVVGLNGGDDKRIRDALDHVVRVLLEKPGVFHKSSSKRRIPRGFEDGSLKSCVKYLLNNCVNLEGSARRKCMELYERLNGKIWERLREAAPEMQVLQKKYDDAQYLNIQTTMLIGLGEFGEFSGESLKYLVGTLDVYIWLIQKKFIEPQILLVDSHPPKLSIFFYVGIFISWINENVIDGAEVVMKIFEFIVEVLSLELSNKDEVHGVLFNDNFCNFMSRCVIKSEELGFDVKNIELMKLLPKKIEQLVQSCENLSIEKLQSVSKILNSNFDHLSKVLSLEDLNPAKVISLKEKVKNLVFMKRCKLLEKLALNQKILGANFEVVPYIFDKLKMYEARKYWCAELTPDMKYHFEGLLELTLDDEGFSWFIRSKTRDIDELLNCDGKSPITHGEYFFISFRNVLVRYLLDNVENSLKLLINSSKQNPDFVLFILNETATWLQRHKKDHQKWAEKFSNSVISAFGYFSRTINNFEKRKKLLKNIYRTVIRLKPELINIRAQNQEMYQWIIQEFQMTQSISEKTQVLNDFLICLVNDSDENIEMRVMLRGINILQGSKNLHKNSLESSEVIQYFQTLITSLPITESLIILEVVTSFAMQLGKYVSNKSTTDHLSSYFSSINDGKALESLEKIHQIFLTSSSPEERLDLLRYFLLPAFKYPSESVINTFFEKNIHDLMSTIKSELPQNPFDRKQLIASQIESYNLLEIMFSTLDLPKINDPTGPISRAICDVTKSNNEVLPQLFKNILYVRKMPITAEEKELMRLLHCAAFNCGVTMVTVSRGEKAMKLLFGESLKTDQLLWERIIDCSKKYSLTQTFKELPKQRKVLVNIRQTLKTRQESSPNHSYLKSYNLASSTLTEDIGVYDMHGMIPLTEPSTSKLSVTLEADDLNDHECMAPIVGVIRFISEVYPSDLSNPPSWLNVFSGGMLIDQLNVKLFLLKIVLNTQEVFKPFASLLLKKIIKMITSVLKNSCTNYIIADGLLMLIDWAEVSVPGEDLKNEVNDMFRSFVDSVDRSSSSEAIVKYNYGIIEMLVKVWHRVLDPPDNLEEKMKIPERAVRLIFTLLQNGLGPKLVDRVNILRFLLQTLESWKEKEEILLQISGAIGLFLNFSASSDTSFQQRESATNKIREIFRKMQEPNRLVKCVHAMCKSFPGLLYEFYGYITHNHLKVTSSTKVKCMEMFLLRIPEFEEEDLYKEITYIKFQDLLQNKVLSCEKICLEIILNLVERLSARIFLPLAQLAANYSDHEMMEYRNLVYDIFIRIFKKYSVDISGDASGKILIDLSQRILLSGLLDPSESIQQKCLNFWTEEIELSTNCPERILDILDKYSPDVSDFLPIFGILFLNLSKKSPNYESILFVPLSKNCNYKNYKIVTSWRMKNLSYRVPLFISSYASQCSQRFTLSSLSSDDFVSTNDDLMVRATNPLEFEPTLPGTFVAEGHPTTSEADDVFAVPATPSRFSRRFLQRKTFLRSSLSHQTRQELLKQQTMKQRSSIKLNRAYRIGELPDIEITHETILNPLQELIKKDRLICKNLIISIICSLLKKHQNFREVEKKKSYQEFTKKIAAKFEKIFQNHRGSGLIVSVALEIILKNPELNFNSTIVSHVAKFTGLEALGALLIEEELMADVEDSEIPSKKSRVDKNDPNRSVDKWVHLGELYESINHLDVVLSIFSNHVPGEELNSASSARSRNNWEEAKSFYEKAIVKEKGAIHRHCKRGLFECLARLSRWEKISSSIESDRSLNDWTLTECLEKTNSRKKRWISLWYFKSKVYQSFIASESSKTFLEDLKILVDDQNKRRLAEDVFTEELSAIYPSTKNEHAKALVLLSLKKSKERWSQLNPLSVQLRLQEVIKLRGICDTKLFRDSLADFTNGTLLGTGNLIEYWERSIPSDKDDLLSWDVHLAQRTHITNVLYNKLGELEDDLGNISHQTYLTKLEVLQKMALIKSSYHQKNPTLMKKYMRDVKNSKVLIENQNLKFQFDFNIVQIKFLRGQIGDDKAKSKNLQDCREKSLELERNDTINVDTAIENLQLMVDWSIEMLSLKDNDEGRFNRIVSELIESSSYLPLDVQLDEYPLDLLKRSIEIARGDPTPQRLQECHLKTLKYCYNRILGETQDDGIIELFVESTLKAISYGSNEATSYFPCLLKEEYLRNERIKEIFIEITKEIPSWKFLKWQPQLFIHLSSSLHQVVTPILERLSEDYPNALFYTFHSTLDTIPEIQHHPLIQQLSNKFDKRYDLKEFVEAMEYLVRPELYLKYHLDNLMKNLHLGKHTVVDRLMKKVYDLKNPLMQGKLYKYISVFKDEVNKIKEMPQANIKDFVEKLKSFLDLSIKKNKDSNNLKDYSPYLSEISNSNIEIPGFYSGETCPDPKYRPRIIKIEGKVQVMKSTRKPIKITIIGDDTKSYQFLVKFGEDLRLDQRLQQTFNVMNEVLRADFSCNQRNLSIKTFKVIPFSGNLGLIEWVDNAKTLQEFIEFSLHDGQKRNLLEAERDYEGWINACSPGETRRSVKYKQAVLKRSAEETIEQMNKLISTTDSEALRRTFQVINPSSESFMSSRRNFITSYSVMCLVQWILGIGDRHLENTLINIESGECTGIDFASAFGGGIDQMIPELMPFRVTNQILRLIKPFDEGDLFSVTMVHVLRALSSHRSLISGVLGVIVHEGLNWMQYKRKFECESQDEGGEVNWVPKRKIRTMMRKLEGDNPAEIMVEELRGQHFGDESFGRYEAIVRGWDAQEKSFRAIVRGKNLTPEEQVRCLLEQATDLNVVGRTYVGWRPYL